MNIGFQILMLFSNSMLMSLGWLDGSSQVEVGKKQTSRERGQALGLGIFKKLVLEFVGLG